MSARFLEAAEAVEHAMGAVGTEAELAETMKVLRYRELIEVAMVNAALQRVAASAQRAKELLPLRADGDDFGQVRMRLPKVMVGRLLAQGNFGYEGLMSDEGQRDILKTYPQYGCKTVSGKITVGYGSKREPRAQRVKINFGGANFNGLEPSK